MINKYFWLKDINSITSVSTLGPKGTSSEAAAEYLSTLINRPLDINLFDSFEKASTHVENASNTALLVANAYQGIDFFYMNPNTILSGAFFFSPPAYYLCCKEPEKLQDKINRGDSIIIGTHPAPKSRLNDLIYSTSLHGINLTNSSLDIIFSKSTSQSAIDVCKGFADCCLVNDNAVSRYELTKISSSLKIKMTWAIFEGRENKEESLL